jgi:exodeoxyribonuclease V gamma subunit
VSLSVHRAERSDALVAGLARLLTAAPADPFAPDVVAVPSRGVERWVSQSLSGLLGTSAAGHDGVCANVVFPSAAQLVREAVHSAAGFAADDDPWAQRRLPWRLLELIDACASEDWCRTLGRHLGLDDDNVDRGRRMAVAQKLAALFTVYGSQRPAMLRDWVAGRDTDGSDATLPVDQAWQAELWRRLRAGIGAESPAERMEVACIRLRDEPDIVQIPQRFSVFGPTRLTTDEIQVIDALGAHRDVHLWLPHPSQGLWQRIAEATGPERGRRTATRGGRVLPARRADPTAHLPHHPLLRSLARDARELQLCLQAQLSPTLDEYQPTELGTDSLLRVLQRDIRDDATPTRGHRLASGDTSVQVHACHGRQRQVEVLREVLLGLLEDDPTLELRDIIVMCPDIEAYAPLISAAFGLSADDLEGSFSTAHPGHQLTVRLADRSLRQTNPVLSVVARLLDLADARISASEVLDLAAMPPVRRRFGFDDDDLDRIAEWTSSSGVRWGVDADTRARFGLSQVTQNTWRAGLDRVLVGVAMDTDGARTFGATLPLDGVDSGDIDLAGRLAELVERLGEAVVVLSKDQPIQAWVTALGATVESFVDVVSTDTWQLAQARRLLTDAVSSAEEYATGTMLSLSDVRALLADRLRGRPTRANFRTGHLTMCTMVPMRSVPHRVVCLLGLDDGVFPRGARIDGDDVVSRQPWVGERDPRSEDRQLFLDAILAARERLVVVYSGADERTGAVRPPAVPLGELLDVLDLTASVAGGSVRDRVLARHPLQPFDARNFQADEIVDGTFAFSFDRAAYDGSQAVVAGQVPRPPFLSGPLVDTSPTGDIGLDTLVSFLEHPVKHFLRQRLGLGASVEEDEPHERLPVTLDALEKWAVGDRLLVVGLGGAPPDLARTAELLRGLLPPGQLGTTLVDPILAEVGGLIGSSAPLRAGPPEQRDVSIALPSGVSVVGTVSSVYADRIVRVLYSRLGAKHRLRAWVQLLALCAQWPERTWEAVTVGRGAAPGAVAASHVGRVVGTDAVSYLDNLVHVYRAGLTMPLPLPAKSASVYAVKRRDGLAVKVAESFAGKQWRTRSGQREIGEFSDPDHQRVWGVSHLDTLLQIRPSPDGDWPDEPHLFGQLARAVWTPLLDAETVT